jgi:hypothetical protein
MDKTKFSYLYLNQPLYQLMLMNIKDALKAQDNEVRGGDNFTIFELTSALGVALEVTKETVMNDYILYCKSIR